MRDTLKKQNGITLASLVITIIVLIILAGVSITYSTDSMEHSKYIAMVSEIQIVQERINVYYSEGKVILESNLNDTHKAILQSKGVSSDKYSNYYYFTNNDLRALLDMDSIEGEYLISVVDRDVICLSTIKKDGNEYYNYRLKDITIGYNVEYVENSATKLSDKASIGDYVNYDPTSGGNVTAANTTYTSVKGTTTAHGNGFANATFSASNYKNAGGKWRILDIDESGTITLISDLISQNSGTGMSTFGVYIDNGVGYIWAEEELHRIASIYGHGKGADTSKTVTYYYGGPKDQDGSITAGTVEAQQGRKKTIDLDSGARALTIKDIDKICGKTYTENYSDATVKKVSENAKYYPTISGTSATGVSTLQSTFSGNYYETNYGYTISSANSDSEAKEKQNTMLNKGTTYWLASRSISTGSTFTNFYVKAVNSLKYAAIQRVCYCADGIWNSENPYSKIVAVVFLETGIQTSDASYPGDEVGWNLAD